MKFPGLFFLLAILSLGACESIEPPTGSVTFLEISTPSKSGGEPNLFVTQNGTTFLSWIEYLNDTTDALQFSKLENDQWSTPKTIAQGHDWFVNWADFPSIVTYHDGKTMAAHWLQKSASGSYDYDIHISQSENQGKQWSEDFILHDDGIAAEHGFVTLIPTSENRIFATWLDGRNTKSGDNSEEDHGHGHGGPMSLRTAEFDSEGKIYEETELDNKICDCCQTDAIMTSNGPIVVYRDRSEDEIRDIYLVRKTGTDWTQPRNISKDGWKIPGCPVNGPSIANEEDQVAVAWFTAADEKPMVKVVFSEDAGVSFSKSMIISDVDPLGRVDVIFKNKKVFLTWLERDEKEAAIMLAVIDPESPSHFEKHYLVKASSSRDSGFPILKVSGNDILLAWTAVDGEETWAKTGRLVFD